MSQRRSVTSLAEALALLRELNAPRRLLRHAELVSEAAEEIINAFGEMKIEIDVGLVRAGAALHDAGKIRHPGELHGKGSAHEPAGEELLLQKNVDPRVARCCLSHARFDSMEVSLEELVVALADKLWKGVHVPELEERAIREVALKATRDFGDVYPLLDSAFLQIADAGSERLSRSL